MLTDNGYNLPSFDDVKNDVQQRFQHSFGDDANIADDSVLGMLIGIMSQIGYRGEELSQAVYNALFWKTCSGATLDAKASDSGIYRKPASNSYVTLNIVAMPTTTIDAGTQFSTEDGHVFLTTDDITIDHQTNQTISGASQPMTDDDGNPLGMEQVQAISQETGSSENILPHKVIYIDEAIDGLVSVDNPNGASGGSDAESDDELRNRGIRNNVKATKGTQDAIENAVLNVTGVVGVKAISNKTMQTNEYGDPAKSVHIYVIGGKDEDVASAIYGQLYLTTKTVGQKDVPVKDIIGDAHDVHFDEAKARPIYVNIHLDIDQTTFNTDDAPDEIREKIMDYFNTLTMGDSVLYSRLFAPSFSASGVTNVDVKLGTDANNLSNSDVHVNEFELPQIDKSNIKIDW